MLLKRFYDDKLAQASYLLGCAATGEALVVDPNRDVDQYVRAAAHEGLRVTHVTETHIHADFVSGSRELSQRTGARLLLSGEGDPDWDYTFAVAIGATMLRDGDSFRVGNLRIDVLHTPGHTPEHLAFMVTDTPATDRPIGVFTGDFVFAGDVGRPDLLERAAGAAGTMESSARTLFASLRGFAQLPDHLQLWPGHGAGSACGKALGAMPSSTLGYEKLVNWGFRALEGTEQRFVEEVLAGQPTPPRYFGTMKRLNSEGPRALHGLPRPDRLTLADLTSALKRAAKIVDTRAPMEYAAAHVPGTINIPLNKSFTTWAGWLLPYDQPLYLIADERCANCLDSVIRDLANIGLDRITGYFGDDVIAEWAAVGGTRGRVDQMSPNQLRRALEDDRVAVVDVRSTAEWETGHLPGARHIPLWDIVARAAELPPDRPIVVQCQSGARSSIAASLLQAAGRKTVSNLAGGIAGWRNAGGVLDLHSSVEGTEEAPWPG